MKLNRFFVSPDKTFIAISQNTNIVTIKKNSWYISDLRRKEDGWKSAVTIPGYFDDELFEMLRKNKFIEIDENSDFVKYVLLFK